MNRIRPCWAPIGTRPEVAAQLIREYIYLYGAVSPKDLYLRLLVDHADLEYGKLPALHSKCWHAGSPGKIPCLFSDGAPNRHRCGALVVPRNIRLLLIFRPIHWSSIRKKISGTKSAKKIFKNFALKSMDAVRGKLRQAILYLEQNPTLVSSITSFPYIVNSL